MIPLTKHRRFSGCFEGALENCSRLAWWLRFPPKKMTVVNDLNFNRKYKSLKHIETTNNTMCWLNLCLTLFGTHLTLLNHLPDCPIFCFQCQSMVHYLWYGHPYHNGNPLTLWYTGYAWVWQSNGLMTDDQEPSQKLCASHIPRLQQDG